MKIRARLPRFGPRTRHPFQGQISISSGLAIFAPLREFFFPYLSEIDPTAIAAPRFEPARQRVHTRKAFVLQFTRDYGRRCIVRAIAIHDDLFARIELQRFDILDVDAARNPTRAVSPFGRAHIQNRDFPARGEQCVELRGRQPRHLTLHQEALALPPLARNEQCNRSDEQRNRVPTQQLEFDQHGFDRFMKDRAQRDRAARP